MALKIPPLLAKALAPLWRVEPTPSREPPPADRYQGVGGPPAAAPRREVFPFSQGRDGGLSPPVDFSRFLDASNPQYATPTQADVVQKLRPVLLEYVATARFGELSGEHGTPIRYAVFDPPPGVRVKGVINLLSGRGESFVKYAETFYALRDLRAEGWVIAAMDHRGQGFSGRELADPQKGHVASFDDFVRDERRFTEVLHRHFDLRGAPHGLVAHSMGGAIAARYLEEHPGEYGRAVLLSPLFDVKSGLADPVEDVVADVAGRVAPEQYASGQHPWRRLAFEENQTTRSPERFELTQQLTELFPQTALGGPTWKWVQQAVAATRQLMRPQAIEQLRGVRLSLLRASDDALVEASAQDRFAQQLGLAPITLPDTRHELLEHGDEVRRRVLDEIRRVLTFAGR